MECREALRSALNYCIVEQLEEKGLVKILEVNELIIYKILKAISVKDVYDAVKVCEPWMPREKIMMDSEMFYSTSILMGRYKCPSTQ